MCILQSHKMWTFEVCHLDLILWIILFLCCMFARTSSNFLCGCLLALVCVSLLGFSLICISIYYLRNHLFHFILTMALPVGLNSWNYQQTLLKYGVLFLISCHIIYLVRMTLDISTHQENISLYSLSLDNWYSHLW